MTKTLDTHEIRIAAYRADEATKFLNAIGNFWHGIHQPVPEYRSNPSKARKHYTYDHAAAVASLLGIDRHHSTLLDIIATIDEANAAGIGSRRLTARNRAAIVNVVTPRS